MVPSIAVARILVRIAAVLIVVMFVEYVAFRTFFTMIALLLVAVPIFTIRCNSCRTPIYDPRISPYVKGFDLEVLEKCPVCGKAMLPEEKGS